MKSRSVVFVLFLFSFFVKAQDRNLDSLLSDFNRAKHDSTRATVYVEFSEILYLSKPDTVIPLCRKAIELCDKNIPKANPSEKRTFLQIRSSACNNIGYIYQNQGDVKRALEYYHQGLKIQEEIGDKKGLAQSLNNIGFVYQSQNDIPKTLDYYNRALTIREEIGDKKGIGESLNNLGLVYRKFGDPDCRSQIPETCMRSGVQKALEYYLRSLKVKEEVKDVNGIGISYNNIGGVYSFLGDYDKALDYFNKSLELRNKINDKQGQSIALNNIGSTYLKKKEYKKAEEFCLRSLAIAEELGFPESVRRPAEALKNIYKATGQFEKTLKYYEVYISMRDSINSREMNREAQKQHFKLEYEKKAAADSIRVEHDKTVAQLQLEHTKNQSYLLVIGLILVLVFAVFMYNRFKITQRQKVLIEAKERETQQQKLMIEDKQKEILDSIQYAKKIQQSLMWNEKQIEKQLNKLKK
jgi:tetratricopeptide (TPR) repeat protein